MFGAKYLAYLLARGLNGGVTFLLIYILTRLLDAKEYGVYSLISTTAAVGASVGFQWLINGFSRYIGSRGFVLDQFVGTVLGVGLVSYSFILFLALIFVYFYAAASSKLLIVYIGIGVITIGLTNFSLQIQNSLGNERKYALVSVVRAVCNCSGALALAYVWRAGDLSFLGGSLLTLIGVSAFFLLNVNIKGMLEFDHLIEYIKYSAPFFFVSLATVLVDFSDRFIIASVGGVGAVGGYAVSYDVAQQTVGVLMNISYLVFFPKLMDYFHSGELVRFKSVLSTLQNSLIATGLVLISTFFLFKVEIARILVASNMRAAVSDNIPYVAAAIFFACLKGYYFDIPLLLEKKTLKFAIVGVFMALVSVSTNWMFVPIWGPRAAPFCMMFSFIVGSLISIFISRNVDYIELNFHVFLKWAFLALPVVVFSELNYFGLADFWGFRMAAALKVVGGLIYFLSGCLALNLFCVVDLRNLYRSLAGRL